MLAFIYRFVGVCQINDYNTTWLYLICFLSHLACFLIVNVIFSVKKLRDME